MKIGDYPPPDDRIRFCRDQLTLMVDDRLRVTPDRLEQLSTILRDLALDAFAARVNRSRKPSLFDRKGNDPTRTGGAVIKPRATGSSNERE